MMQLALFRKSGSVGVKVGKSQKSRKFAAPPGLFFHPVLAYGSPEKPSDSDF